MSRRQLFISHSMALSIIIIATATLTSCGSDGPGGDGSCRDSAQCSDQEGCVGPADLFCGIPPERACLDDTGCTAPTDLCHAIADSCSANGVGSRCGPPCDQPQGCGAGFTCAADSRCVAQSCDAPGASCRASETCDPTAIDPTAPVPDRGDGCLRISCQGNDDSPCPNDTVCVNSYCQTGFGICSGPAA